MRILAFAVRLEGGAGVSARDVGEDEVVHLAVVYHAGPRV